MGPSHSASADFGFHRGGTLSDPELLLPVANPPKLSPALQEEVHSLPAKGSHYAAEYSSLRSVSWICVSFWK